MKLSEQILDGQSEMVVFPHKDGAVEIPSLDAGTLKSWQAQAADAEEVLDDLYMAILEAGWSSDPEEQHVYIEVEPELMARIEAILGES